MMMTTHQKILIATADLVANTLNLTMKAHHLDAIVAAKLPVKTVVKSDPLHAHGPTLPQTMRALHPDPGVAKGDVTITKTCMMTTPHASVTQIVMQKIVPAAL